MEYDLSKVHYFTDAYSWGTNGGVDNRFYLFRPNREIVDGETEYLLLENPSMDMFSEEYEIKYKFTAPHTKNCFKAIDNTGEYACIGYSSKYGVMCYELKSELLLWQIKNIKGIKKVRFNRMNQKVVEVINKNNEITYLHLNDGIELSEEERKEIRQFPTYMRTSENGKYIIIADRLISDKDIALYSVYEESTQKLIAKFVGATHVNPRSFGITNDGKYAICLAYNKAGVSMYEVSTGLEIWNEKLYHPEFIEIDDAKKELYVNYNQGGCSKHELLTGKLIENSKCNKKYFNQYGKMIELPQNNLCIVGRKKIQAFSFAFIRVISVPEGILLVSAGSGVQYVNHQGEIIWEKEDYQITNVGYIEDENYFYGYNMNSDSEKIFLIAKENGEIITETHSDADVMCAIDGGTKLLCSTGEIYKLTEGKIEKSKENFLFSI